MAINDDTSFSFGDPSQASEAWLFWVEYKGFSNS